MPDHAGPVATVAINDLTGDIVTCAGSWLYLWDIGGRPLARIDTNAVCPPLSPQPQQQQILCVACSQMNEWDRENVIMTGSSDGVVRYYTCHFLRLSDIEKCPKIFKNVQICQIRVKTSPKRFFRANPLFGLLPDE